MKLTLLDFQNPDLRLAVEAAARQHSARQIVALVELALTYLFSRKDARAPGTHLARQG